MKKLLPLFITLFCLQKIYAQADFRNGFIITNEGDTITGLIDYREGRKNFKVCDFKKTIDSEVMTYGADQISAYRFFNDKFFQSRDISETAHPENVFLEVLVGGKASLFKHSGRYFVSRDTIFIELKKEQKEVIIEGKAVVRNRNEYIGILSYLVSDCVGLRDEVYHIGLSEKELTGFIEKYNYCIGEQSITYKGRKPWFEANTGIAVALATSSIKFGSVTQGTKHLTSFDRDYFFSAGVSFELNSPRLNEKMAFIAGIYYLKSNYTSFNTQKRSLYIDRNDVYIKLEQLKIPVGLRYNFPERNRDITPYINFGASSTLHLNASTFWIRETERDNIVGTTEREALEVNKYQIGYWGGVGVKKELNSQFTANLEIRYELTDGIAVKDAVVTSEIENIQLLIGITF